MWNSDQSKNTRMLRKVKRRPKWLELLGLTPTKESVVKWRLHASATALLVGLLLTVYSKYAYQDTHLIQESHGASRHLLATDNATAAHGPEWESCDFELATVPGAWVFSHAICIMIIFIALAIVCDDFFVPSLEVISEKLQLSEDVAGATFMAAGSSAPELFTSVAGVIVQTDVGVGTIVGSAVFNMLIIIALTAALAGQVLHLDWRPLTRDSFFYAMSIGCFIGFSWDGYFQHYESVILLILYILYIVLMVFNPKLMDWLGSWKCCSLNKPTSVSPTEEDRETGGSDAPTQETNLNSSNPKLHDQNNVNHANSLGGRRMSMTGGHARRLSIIHGAHSGHDAHDPRDRYFHHQRGSIVGVLGGKTACDDVIREESETSATTENGKANKEKEVENTPEPKEEEEEEEEESTLNICPCLPCCCPVRSQPPNADDAREQGTCWGWTKLVIRWILFIPAFPFVVLFSWTIPDCSKDHNKKWYIMSFVMSVVWIAILSFGMVTLVGRTGCILGIDTYVMGLVVVAIGTSIPDAISSILVAREGYGDMAVSNAIGSNVFDINLGLGLPFLVRTIIDGGAPISLLDNEEWVDYFSGKMAMTPHAKFGFILLLLLMVAMTVFIIAKFHLTKFIGITFVIIYFMFIAYAITQDYYCTRTLGIYC